MKTFTKIENLLEEIERKDKTQDLMISGGCVGRSHAGTNFYMTLAQQSNDIRKQLNEYPSNWVNAVRTIMHLRKQ